MSKLLDEPATVPSGQIVVPPAATWAGAAPKMLGMLRHPGVRRTFLGVILIAALGMAPYLAYRDVVSSVDDSGTDIRSDLAVVMTNIGHLSDEQRNIRDRLRNIELGQNDIMRKVALQDATVAGLRTRVDSLAGSVERFEQALTRAIDSSNKAANNEIWRARQKGKR